MNFGICEALLIVGISFAIVAFLFENIKSVIRYIRKGY
jgi:hypothetical protein